MSECVDLRDFGDRFKIRNEPEDRPARKTDDPWDLIVPGSRGFVAPYGGEDLLACTNHSTTMKRLLATVPGAKVVQDGTDGQNVRFDVTDLGGVAEVLRLRKRRRVSEEQRATMIARTARYRFRPAAQVTFSTR
jgi:hypothetical protein